MLYEESLQHLPRLRSYPHLILSCVITLCLLNKSTEVARLWEVTLSYMYYRGCTVDEVVIIAMSVDMLDVRPDKFKDQPRLVAVDAVSILIVTSLAPSGPRRRPICLRQIRSSSRFPERGVMSITPAAIRKFVVERRADPEQRKKIRRMNVTSPATRP